MKAEKEYFILINLLNSNYIKKFFRTPSPVSVRELETFLGFSQNNMQFRRWLSNLLKTGAMECVGTKKQSKGQKAKVYLFDSKMLNQLIKTNPLYNLSWKFYQNKALLGFMEN